MKALVAVVLAVGVVVCAAATARAAEGGEAARVSLGRRGWFDNLLNPTSSLPTTKAFGAFATKPQVPVVPGLRGVAALGKPTDLETMSWGQAAAMSAKELQTRTSALVKYFVSKVTGASSTPQTVTQCMNPQASLWRPDTARLAASAVYLAVEAYNIGRANTPVVVGRNLPWHEPGQQPFTVVYQDLNGRRTKHLGDYTGPFFVAKQGTWLWVAFRGSDTGSDWAHDLTALWTDVSLDVGAGKAPLAIGNMHLGFAEIWQQYRFSGTLAALRAKYPDVTRVFYTGHSLGGALAQLAALEHGYKFGGVHPVVFTFGSPRVFGKTLHDDFKRRCIHYRFKHNNDPVPSVPTFDVACTLATAVNLDAELVAAGLDGRCGRRFYHSADSSVRFFYRSRSGEVGNALSCVNEDNSYVGFNVMDHMSANYGRRVFDLAIEQSRAQGYNFNAGVNLYPPKN